MTTLFKIQNGQLVRAKAKALAKESMIEDWVSKDPALLGLDAIVIGRQVSTDHGKYIDLLALDRSGGVIIIELKKDRTPREIVAQVLDYASWIRGLNTPQIYSIAENYRTAERLTITYQNHFGDRIPERLNTSHSMLIVASEMDDASKRIVEYLSEEHGVSINTAFFNVFEADGNEWLTTDFLLDQSEVEERSERRTMPPWSGYYYVNAGDGDCRSWEDMRRYGFIAAGGGQFYSGRLDQLSEGDKIFAYQKQVGYIGYGIVTSPKSLASEFLTENGFLFDQPLTQPLIKHDADDPAIAEYAVGVNWIETHDFPQAKWFKGAFANQNIVCKLRDPATVDFLLSEFGVSSESGS
jgi:hypothetical protein